MSSAMPFTQRGGIRFPTFSLPPNWPYPFAKITVDADQIVLNCPFGIWKVSAKEVHQIWHQRAIASEMFEFRIRRASNFPSFYSRQPLDLIKALDGCGYEVC